MTLWRPDTCECVIETKAVDGEMCLKSLWSKCEKHKGLTDNFAFKTVLAENKAANLARLALEEANGGL